MNAYCIIDFPRDKQSPLSGRFENPRALLQAWKPDEVIPLLRQIEAHTAEGRWAIGMLAYEAATAFDPALQTHAPSPDLPLAAFAIFDAPAPPQSEPKQGFTCSIWQNSITKNDFEKTITGIRDDIAAGRYYQTNFTSRLHADFNGNAESLFRALREAQPESYALFLDFGPWQIASVSPELFFSWNPKNGELVTRPMKGTAALDASDLSASPKDRAENLMIVDLLRNDIAHVADQISVPELFTVKTLSTARQMTSTVTGTTRQNTDLAAIFGALFPCGSVTGAPKIAAMQAIKKLEPSPRGAYCGALGIIEPGGKALFNVGIRSVTIQNGKAVAGIGSGITWDSNPTGEYAENQLKQRFLWRASASFDLLETMRLENGKHWLLDRHLSRLTQSAAYFGFIYDAAAVQKSLTQLAQRNPTGIHRVRLLVDRRGFVKTEIFPLEANPETALIEVAVQPITDSEFLHHKTTNRAIYESSKPKNPAMFDTLLHNQRNEITEFTRGNVAIELDGKLVTPPESSGLLAGTLRAEMLTNGKLHEQIITRDDLERVTAIWFFNGLRGMIKVMRHPGEGRDPG